MSTQEVMGLIILGIVFTAIWGLVGWSILSGRARYLQRQDASFRKSSSQYLSEHGDGLKVPKDPHIFTASEAGR